MIKIKKFKYLFQLVLLGTFLFGFLSNITIDAQGRACCNGRTGSVACDYCSPYATKTSTSVPASEGADYYGCGGNTNPSFIQYDSANNPICRVCPLAYPYSIACTLPGPPVTPPNPACGGACTNNSQCPLVDGRVHSVCSNTLHVCVNPLCPDSSQLGSQCYCLNATSRCGDKCGNWPDAKYPLCGDGVSSCAPLSGPSCPGLATTYCLPVNPAPGYTRPVCTSDLTYKYLRRPDGSIANSQADVLAACSTCTGTAPGAAVLIYPGPGAVIPSATPTLNVITTIDLNINGWGSGCPSTVQTWNLNYSINGGAFQSIVSNVIPNVPIGASVAWYVMKSNGTYSAQSITYFFNVVGACVPSAPAAATLTAPADNSTIGLLPGNTVNVSYAVNAWGTSCAGTQTTRLEIQRNCTGAFVANASPTLITGLNVNDLICWRVVKNNGSLTSTSTTWRFTVKPDEKAWLLGYNGDVSAAGGMQGLSVPSGLNTLSGTLSDRNGVSIINDNTATYTSSYSLIVGNNSLPNDKQSKYKEYTSNYDNLAIKPPLDTGFTNWYDYLNDVITKNAISTFTTYPGDATLSTTSSALAAVGFNTKKYVQVNGNLTVNANTTCDTQSIIFVVGNITINPDFKLGQNIYTNGCLFISKGDITINNGGRASAAINTNSTALASYDSIEAALITNGRLITNLDVTNSTEKGDGLSIRGSVTTNDVLLQRDINLNGNQYQPAQVFYYDPRYREIFKTDLNYNKYSIRETGYTTSN